MDNTLATYVGNKITHVLNVVPTIQYNHHDMIVTWDDNQLTFETDHDVINIVLIKNDLDTSCDVVVVVSPQQLKPMIDIIIENERIVKNIKYHIWQRSGDKHPVLAQDEEMISFTWEHGRYHLIIIDMDDHYECRKSYDNQVFKVDYDQVDDFIDYVF